MAGLHQLLDHHRVEVRAVEVVYNLAAFVAEKPVVLESRRPCHTVAIVAHSSATEQAEQTAKHVRRVHEIWLVLGVSLLRPAAFSILDLVSRRGTPIKGTTAVITDAPAQVEELIADLLRVGFGLVPVLLVGHLLTRDGEGWGTLRLDRSQPARDLRNGAGIAAAVGAVGLAFYVLAVHIGLTRTIIPVGTGGPWWTTPLLLLQAAQNAVLEEVIVGAYLLHRLRQIGWQEVRVIATAAVLRGTYHLYQGYGPFLANAVMGVAFALWLRSGRRTWPLVVAHFLIDAVVFVGWFWFRDHLGWLPR